MKKREWDRLFSDYDLRAVLETQLRAVGDEVLKVPRERFDTASDELIAAEIASKLVISSLEIHETDIEVETSDAKVDVSQDFDRAVSDRSRPFYVDGVQVTYHVPFSGTKELMRCRPSQFSLNPPRAVIGNGELRFPYDSANRDVTVTKRWFDEDLRRLKEWLPWVTQQVVDFNKALETQAKARVAARRVDIEKERSQVASLGFKVRSAAPPQSRTSTPEDRMGRRSRARAKVSREYDVALSFAGEDREFVERVAEGLKEAGVAVFYDGFEQVNLWGEDLAEHLGEVYGKRSRFVVLFLSRSYAAKAWPHHEKQFALARQIETGVTRVLPVRFDDTEIPGLPSTISYLDLRVLTPEKLVELIRQKVDTDEPDA